MEHCCPGHARSSHMGLLDIVLSRYLARSCNRELFCRGHNYTTQPAATHTRYDCTQRC